MRECAEVRGGMDFLQSIWRAADTHDWLISANLLFSALLLLWILRYRLLYLTAEKERREYRDTIENLSEGFYRSSMNGRQILANSSLVRLNGYESEAQMLAAVGDIGAEWYVDPERRAEFVHLLNRDGRVQDFISQVYRHGTRERIWVSESARLVRDQKTGDPFWFEGSVRDVTGTWSEPSSKNDWTSSPSMCPAVVPAGAHADGSFSLPFMSAGFRKILPAHDELLAYPESFLGFVHPSDLPAYRKSLLQSQRSMKPWSLEFRVVGRDAEMVWVSCLGNAPVGG